MADPSHWRKATIVSDCVVRMVSESPQQLSGQALIDEEYLRSRGVSDFSQYQCVAGVEPPKVWPPLPSSAIKVGGDGVPPGVQARL